MKSVFSEEVVSGKNRGFYVEVAYGINLRPFIKITQSRRSAGKWTKETTFIFPEQIEQFFKVMMKAMQFMQNNPVGAKTDDY